MEQRIITARQLRAFQQHLEREERSARHGGEVPAGGAAVFRLAGRGSGEQGVRRPVEGAPPSGRILSRHRQRQAHRPGPAAGLSGVGGLPGQAPEAPAAAVPGHGAGADPGGIRAAAVCGGTVRAGAPDPADGSHLRHRNPRLGGKVPHCEAARAGRAEIALKGKIRTILIPGKLCRKLLQYAREQNIASGEIFLTRGGNSLSRKQIWADMKDLCRQAGVAPSKVFPHNLRHLFARTFLPGVPGRGQAGRRAGPFQHRNHPRLPHLHRRGTRQGPGAAQTDPLTPDRICLLSG